MARARDIIVRFLGDTKSLVDANSRAGRSFSQMSTAVKAVSFVAIARGLDILKDMAEVAAEDAKSIQTLSNALRQNTDASEAQISANEKWITSMMVAANVADNELRQALQSLIVTGVSLADAQKIVATSLDVAASRGKDFTAVIEAMVKASATGSTAGLGRLGLATKDAAGEALTLDEILNNLGDTMGGAAARGAATLAGGLERAAILMDEAAEAAGARGLPAWSKFSDVWAIIRTQLSGGNKELAILNERFNNLIREGVDPFADSVGSAIDVLVSMLRETDVSKDTFEALQTILGLTTDQMADLRTEIAANGRELGLTAEQQRAFLLSLDIGAVEAYHNSLDAGRHRRRQFVTDAHDLDEALRGAADAQLALASPAFAAAEAANRAADAEDRYNEAVKEHGPNSEEAERAALDLGQELGRMNAAANLFADEGGPAAVTAMHDMLEEAGVLAETLVRIRIEMGLINGAALNIRPIAGTRGNNSALGAFPDEDRRNLENTHRALNRRGRETGS